MKAQEFLYTKLKVLSEHFPEIHIKYGFDSLIDTHIVELLPVSEYYTNKNLDEYWISIAEEFLEKYQDEEVAFISSDSSLSLSNFIFEIKPTLSFQEDKLLSKFFEKLMNQNFSSSTITANIISTSVVTNNSKSTLPNLMCKNPIKSNSNSTAIDNSSLAMAA